MLNIFIYTVIASFCSLHSNAVSENLFGTKANSKAEDFLVNVLQRPTNRTIGVAQKRSDNSRRQLASARSYIEFSWFSAQNCDGEPVDRFGYAANKCINGQNLGDSSIMSFKLNYDVYDSGWATTWMSVFHSKNCGGEEIAPYEIYDGGHLCSCVMGPEGGCYRYEEKAGKFKKKNMQSNSLILGHSHSRASCKKKRFWAYENKPVDACMELTEPGQWGTYACDNKDTVLRIFSDSNCSNQIEQKVYKRKCSRKTNPLDLTEHFLENSYDVKFESLICNVD